jgi:hypothetical protein
MRIDGTRLFETGIIGKGRGPYTRSPHRWTERNICSCLQIRKGIWNTHLQSSFAQSLVGSRELQSR